MDKKIKVGITQGDINGVGYEIIFNAFSDEAMLELCTPVIYGSPKVATYHKKAIENQINFTVVPNANSVQDGRIYMINCFGERDLKVEFGTPTEESGNAALISLDRALADYLKGDIDVLVTMPLNPNTIKSLGIDFPGQTEYIERQVGQGINSIQMLLKDGLRIGVVTSHIPLSRVANSITKETVKEKIVMLNNSLERDFMIDRPRIAVLSLNPRGCDGTGSEENEIIEPAIAEVYNEGVLCFGPYLSDEFFSKNMFSHYDGILAMYHDQAFAPFKSVIQNAGSVFTGGLPVIRTAPTLGTEYDIAGKGIADLQSFREAIYSAIDIYKNRLSFDMAKANPLQKQYYEKKDDSYKLKLDQEEEAIDYK